MPLREGGHTAVSVRWRHLLWHPDLLPRGRNVLTASVRKTSHYFLDKAVLSLSPPRGDIYLNALESSVRINIADAGRLCFSSAPRGGHVMDSSLTAFKNKQTRDGA